DEGSRGEAGRGAWGERDARAGRAPRGRSSTERNLRHRDHEGRPHQERASKSEHRSPTSHHDPTNTSVERTNRFDHKPSSMRRSVQETRRDTEQE
ncbi:MAG: pseudouridine synthase, partial [Chloroflexus sp.]